MIESLHKNIPTSLKCDVLQHKLSNHSLYSGINTSTNLKIFMQHHVYAVWDFMSLIKSLQQQIAPSNTPWTPPACPRFANFINRLVLEEESDHALTNNFTSTHASHFESYLYAMVEAGIDIQPIHKFINAVKIDGVKTALTLPSIPEPSRKFMQFTFELIERDKPYLTASALAYGREDLVPHLFKCIESSLDINENEAPSLFAYLHRHIQVDGEDHGPIAIQFLKELCEGSTHKQAAAIEVAEQALKVVH